MTEDMRKVAEEALYLYRISPSHVKDRKQCKLLGMLAAAWMIEHPEPTEEPDLPDDQEKLKQAVARLRECNYHCDTELAMSWQQLADLTTVKDAYLAEHPDFGPQKQPASVNQVEAQTKSVRKSMVERLSE